MVVIINMLKFHNYPALQALTMNVSRWPRASTRCHMQIFIIFLHQPAESAIDVKQGPLFVEIVMVDETSVCHMSLY